MNYDDFDGMENYSSTGGASMTYEDIERIAASKVRGSMLWMVLGLLITGITGYFTLIGLVTGMIPMWILPVALVLEFVAVIAFTALTYKSSANVLRMIFIVYSFLTGITLSVIGATYSLDVIISAFLGTVVLFTVMAVYGYMTREDLSKYRSILLVGLISLVVMGIINIFIGSSQLMWISSMIGVALFTIFTAYDINRIKNSVISYALYEDASILDKIEIHGALSLYLDFVNLFIYMLRILGRRK